MSTGGNWTVRDRRVQYLRDGGQCTYITQDGVRCKARVGLEIDHRIPKAKGGMDDLSNLRLLCREHNRTEAVREFGAALVGPQRRGRARADDLPLFQAGTGTPEAPDSS